MRHYLFIKACWNDGKNEIAVTKTTSSPENQKGKDLLDKGYLYVGSFAGFNVSSLCIDYKPDGTKL